MSGTQSKRYQSHPAVNAMRSKAILSFMVQYLVGNTSRAFCDVITHYGLHVLGPQQLRIVPTTSLPKKHPIGRRVSILRERVPQLDEETLQLLLLRHGALDSSQDLGDVTSLVSIMEE